MAARRSAASKRRSTRCFRTASRRRETSASGRRRPLASASWATLSGRVSRMSIWIVLSFWAIGTSSMSIVRARLSGHRCPDGPHYHPPRGPLSSPPPPPLPLRRRHPAGDAAPGAVDRGGVWGGDAAGDRLRDLAGPRPVRRRGLGRHGGPVRGGDAGRGGGGGAAGLPGVERLAAASA